MSLLLDAGHPHANSYPLNRVFMESAFVVKRRKMQMAAEAILIQAAVTSLFSSDGGKLFQDLINKTLEV